MDAHVVEWLNLTVRWIHFITGIAWIGSSFYFNWLENALNKQGLREGIAGNLWAIHGGGFYYLEKYKVAPKVIPKTLHWFKYEAYFTWISGFALLIIVYYYNAGVYMVDSDSSTHPALAVLLGIGSLIVGWFIYDTMCKTPLINKPVLFTLVGFLIVVAISYYLTQMLSSRAAYLHVGAMLGTCMAANVFLVIIPSQKKLVESAKQGKEPDAFQGRKAFLRSLHNNYMTLPVLFIMISNHFPSTYGSEFNWAVLAGLFVVGTGVRHYYNLLGKGQNIFWILPAAVVGMIGLAMVTKPPPAHQLAGGRQIEFSEAQALISKRCVSCHSANPTDKVFVVAPKGVMFDTPDQIVQHQDKIFIQAVTTKVMPLGNTTFITEEEREIIGAWIQQGAIIE